MTGRRTDAHPRAVAFYDRPVNDVARALLGCTLRHGEAAGRIVETEGYHEDEAACHAHIGLTERTRVLLGPPGIAYVYRSYGIHALLNVVCERDGVGAAALIRALEPLEGSDRMRERRGTEGIRDLCSGPGKLTQALGVSLALNGSTLADGPIVIEPRAEGDGAPEIVAGPRVGITKAAELPWRFCLADRRFVSRPLPPGLRRAPAAPVRA